ncbi:hypothetical protein D3C83_216400 [compost metagenome]
MFERDEGLAKEDGNVFVSAAGDKESVAEKVFDGVKNVNDRIAKEFGFSFFHK